MEDPSATADIPSLEERRVLIEEKKVDIDLEKNRIERLKAWSGSASTFASLVVVAGTISLGIWSQYQQSKLQHELQVNQARAQFELKAAELVMATDSPRVTRNKARALQSLFPQYLSENFAESFVAEEFAQSDADAALTAMGDRKQPVSSNKMGDRTLAMVRTPTDASAGSSAFTFKGGSRIAYQRQVNGKRPSPISPDDDYSGGSTRNKRYMPPPVYKSDPRRRTSPTPTPTPVEMPEPTPGP